MVCPGKKDGAFSFSETSQSLTLDVIFPVMHGTYGEDGAAQGFLKFIDMPFVGPCVLGSSLCMDKIVTKKVLASEGLPVCASLSFEDWERKDISFDKVKKVLGLPVFVKSARLGSSVGVSKATDESSFNKAVEEGFLYDSKILIEEGLEARELETAILGHGAKVEASCVGEVVTDHDFYSYDAKYVSTDSLRLEIPAKVPEEISEELRGLALRAFRVLDCSGLARCDFFYKSDGSLVINEINTIPGFTDVSMYPKLWAASGLSYPDLIQRLLSLAIEKHRQLSSLKTSLGA